MGFDNECILNIQALAGEYFCPVCRMLVYPNEALQSQCTHLYCKPCLAYIVGTTRACPYDGYLVTEADSKSLIESNKALAETIGRIVVHCLYHRSGCPWQGPLSECTTHCLRCAFGNSPVVCNRCAIQIVHRQVQEHAQTCPGVNPQAEQVADIVTSPAATAANQTKAAPQLGAPPASQAQLQAVAAPTTQAQTVTTTSQLTQEQHQLQYYQYYQYGYDPYQQFYVQQQLVAQQFQSNAQGQLQHHVYTQPQAQPRPQAPSQALARQHHHQPQAQGQVHAYIQGPVVQQNKAQVNPQQQLHPAVQPNTHNISQSHPPSYGLVPLQAQQPYYHPQPQPEQSHQHQNIQASQYQYPHVQMQPQQQLHSSPLRLAVPNAQPQGQQSSPQAMTGHHSYPQVQAHQHMLPPPPPQHPLHIHPSSGPLPPAQVHGQFPPPPPQMHPPQSLTSLQNQQPPALLPSHVHVPNISPAQQQQIHPHSQQPGHAVQQHLLMQQIQQPVPQQCVQQQQPFPGQTGPVQAQLHQHTPFAPQQSMHSQSRPQGQPRAYLQPKQGVAVTHVYSHLSQPFSQTHGTFGVPSQVGPMQLGSNQASGHQSQQFVQSGPSIKTTTERKGDVLLDGTVMEQEAQSPSQKTAEKGDNGSGVDSLNVKALKSEIGQPLESEDNSRHGGPLVEDKDYEVHEVKDGSGEPVVKRTLKEEGNDGILDSLPGAKSIEIAAGEGKKVEHPVDDSSLRGTNSVEANKAKLPTDALHVSMQSSTWIGSDIQHSRDCMQHSYPRTPQGLAFDESGGLQGKGFVPPSDLGPFTDQGRRQLPPMPYTPSAHHQIPDIPLMGQSCPLPGPPSNEQAPGYPPNLLRPQGPDHLSQPGQPLNPLGGVLSFGSTVYFRQEPGHFGHLQRSFELQSSAPQNQYGQGPMPLPHAGFPRTSQGDPVGGPPLTAAPPSSFDPQGGIVGGALPHVPEGQFGQRHPSNPVEAEMFHNQRPGHDSSSTIGLRDERLKSIIKDRPNPFSMGQTLRFDQEKFKEGSRQFPRPSNLGLEASPKFGSYFSSRTTDRGPNGLGIDASLRPLDKPFHGSKYDTGLKMDSGFGSVPSRFLPPYHIGVALHPNDAGERAPTSGHNNERFGRHHMEHLTPRSPGIDGREPHSIVEGSRPFNLPPDQGGNSSRGSRFPTFPGHLQSGELSSRGNLQMGEHLSGELIGQDNLPSHLRKGEHWSHRNLPSHPHLGEFNGNGNFPHHLPFSESFGSTKVSHPHLGEPAFRSSYSKHGFPNDGGLHSGDPSSFDQLRKRKPANTGWCRICEFDCETVEGLELHSQTREHQKMAMDMVMKIKQQNAKKLKMSNNPSHGAASKSRNAGFESRANKP